MSRLTRAARSLLGLFGSDFQDRMADYADALGAGVVELKDATAVLSLDSGGETYLVVVNDDGTHMTVGCFSLSVWPGGAPPQAYELMRRLDEEHPALSYRVTTSGGTARCGTLTRVPGLDRLTRETFAEAAAAVVRSMAFADRMLRRHGFA
ncbi:MAG: hypothetical protein C0501_26410 [Isosphaera sp.]|nr:hypothetical protein [Isosphaera sp.]